MDLKICDITRLVSLSSTLDIDDDDNQSENSVLTIQPTVRIQP